MKVLIAGATGAIGSPLSRTLRAAGYEVLGITRSPAGSADLSAAGVQPIVADAMDRSALLTALDAVSADVVVHQLTALTKAPARHRDMTQTNRLRTEGTKNLLDAARVVGARRFVTQSIIFGYGYTDHGDNLITEENPFGQLNSGKANPHVAAMLANERLVDEAEGITGLALRYGLFYGADVQNYAAMLRKRKLPIPTKRNNPLSWIHVDDAAGATAAAVEGGAAGAYNIVDDRPASWTEMFAAMASTLDAPPPRALPPWLIRLAAPYVATIVLDTTLRVSNAKAKAELGWQPEYPTLSEGLRTMKAQLRGEARTRWAARRIRLGMTSCSGGGFRGRSKAPAGNRAGARRPRRGGRSIARGSRLAARVALVHDLLLSGHSTAELVEAHAQDRMALLPVTDALREDGNDSLDEIARRYDVPGDGLARLRQASGPAVSRNAVYGASLGRYAAQFRRVLDAGLDLDTLVTFNYVVGSAAASVAAAARDAMRVLLLDVDPEGSEHSRAVRAAELTQALMPTVGEVLLVTLEEHLRQLARREVTASLVTSDVEPLTDVSIGFADLVGYTALGDTMRADRLGEVGAWQDCGDVDLRGFASPIHCFSLRLREP